jgi:hypothetical protein
MQFIVANNLVRLASCRERQAILALLLSHLLKVGRCVAQGGAPLLMDRGIDFDEPERRDAETPTAEAIAGGALGHISFG